MTRRGLTLVEVVVSLALLGALAIGATSWTVTSAQLAKTADDRANRESAAHAVLRLIGDDLRTFDSERVPTSGSARRPRRSSGGPEKEWEARVQVEGSTIVVKTRSAASMRGDASSAGGGSGASGGSGGAMTEHRYAFDSSSRSLTLTVGHDAPRALLHGVGSLKSTLDRETGVLTVVIELDDLGDVGRTYVMQ